MDNIFEQLSDYYLEKALKQSIEVIEELYKQIEEENLLNDQRVLDWLDKLNEISVRQ